MRTNNWVLGVKGLSDLDNTLRGNRKLINRLINLTFCIVFFQRNFSKLKASCDVKATKGSKRNLNLLQIPTFDFGKNIHSPPCFFN